ncbi:MAG: ferritin-like domain-containing protein [Myxococcales bacterium]|nr:ferritin-like domain-containing protein [Myxococcales bacterium]
MLDSFLGLRGEILAALGCVALLGGCAGGDDGKSDTGESEGSSGEASSSSTDPSGGSMSSTSAASTSGSASDSASGGSTSAGTTSAGTGSTSGGSTSDATTGVATTSSTSDGTTGSGVECDPVPVPPPTYTSEEACFPLPEGLASCDECDEACALPLVDAAITGDPLFCSADGLILLCGPEPNSRPGQCCYYAAYTGIVCEGRPLRVAGEARVAPLRPRGDWLGEPGEPASAALDRRTREALAAAWGEDGQMEHASVAAFARHILHLMALGAPAELVSAAQAALADEIGHARACFALASAYAGHPRGPGALPIDGALARTPTLVELAVDTVVEGCVGETIAASIARLAAAGAGDPAARGVLAAIADDESRHAALAWRIVRWAIEVGGATVRGAVAEALAGAIARPPRARAALPGVEIAAWEAHGRLSEANEAAAIRGTLREVIEPCARALLGAAPPAIAEVELLS